MAVTGGAYRGGMDPLQAPGDSHEANALYYVGAARMAGADAHGGDEPLLMARLAQAEATLAVAAAIRDLAAAVAAASDAVL
jgi:tetraacyldisaccharide-1-P 4'-kinase